MLVSGLIRVVKIMEVVLFSFECEFVECLVLADRKKHSELLSIDLERDCGQALKCKDIFPTHALNTVAPSFPLLPLFFFFYFTI